MSGFDQFTFLNETRRIPRAEDWNDSRVDRLWLYNLHYFDDLNAESAHERVGWHRELIRRWVTENPGPEGVGWEPYPLSRRVVNWTKWALAGNRLPGAAFDSLATQVRYLEKRTEVHLYGNHLLANAKALVFAGLFFEGEEAERWHRRGFGIIHDQAPEQVLEDGGHFERSPMYHAIVLEDLLDIVNLRQGFGLDAPEAVTRVIEPMERWLETMTHPDRQIAFFNDAAFGVAASPDDLADYARQLGFEAGPPPLGTTFLESTGYVRLENRSVVVLLDVAQLGPDYLPGHGHADTLSFELSFNGRRVVINSGTSVYEPGLERLRQRRTPAHSTVTVDDQDSSEVWGAFRVGRRARPFGLTVDAPGMRVECAHDGYQRLPGRVVHNRSWHLAQNFLEVTDTLEGSWSRAVARFHIHPDVRVEPGPKGNGVTLYVGDHRLLCRADGGEIRVRPSTYHPEFGRSEESVCIEITMTTATLRCLFEWA